MTPTGTRNSPLDKGKNKRKYIYLQIADIMEALIREGRYKTDEKLPSMDELARRHEVNKLTINKAFRELAERGVIYTVPARGTYVADTSIPAEQKNIKSGFDGTSALTGKTIGMVSREMVPEQTGYYHLMLSEAIRSALAKHGTGLNILPVATVEPEIKVVDIVKRAGLDGLICVGEISSQLMGGLLKRLDIPTVMLDYRVAGVECDTICQDNELGAYKITEHLIKSGYNEISIVSGPKNRKVSTDRLSGIHSALEHYNATKPLSIIFSDFTREGGYASMTKIMSQKKLPEAVIFMNDEMIIGAMKAAVENKLRIPDDIALCGYDNIPEASTYGLTTIKAPIKEMATTAIEQLARRTAGYNGPSIFTCIAPDLLQRQSTPKKASPS